MVSQDEDDDEDDDEEEKQPPQEEEEELETSSTLSFPSPLDNPARGTGPLLDLAAACA